MANENVNEQVEGLKALRAYVVQTRRTSVSAIAQRMTACNARRQSRRSMKP